MVQVHEAVEEAKDVGEMGSQIKAVESVTADFGIKEYEYSYKDYNEPGPDGQTGGDIGHVLAAVTDEEGVSHVVLSGTFKDDVV